MHLASCILLVIPFLPASAEAGAGVQSLSDTTDSPKIGLALSGGGAKGFAHIGVLKVLEEEGIPVDVVTGTSMGAIVGGLYAAGYSPGQIEKIMVESDWQTLMNDNYRPTPEDLSTYISRRDRYLLSFPIHNRQLQLPVGLIDGQNISMLLYRLTLPWHSVTDFSELPISFGSVATDLATGEAVLFNKGYLPDAIRASIAIPTIFKPVQIEGKPYIDGGVARNIPAEDARTLGADLVISSDVGEPLEPVDSLETFLDILSQSVGFHQMESDIRQKELTDVYIRPDIERFDSFSYDKAIEIIKEGEKAARAMLPELRKKVPKKGLSDTAASARNISMPGAGINDSLVITRIEFSNIEQRLVRQTEVALGLRPPERLSFRDIEERINDLYATELFSHVSYRLEKDTLSEEGRVLTIHFSYRKPNRVGFSIRYDSRYKASLLFGLRLKDQLAWGDEITTDLRLGEVLGSSSRYSIPVSLSPLTKFTTDLNFYRSPVDWFNNQNRIATVNVERINLHPALFVQLRESWNFQAGINAEYFHLDETVGSLLLENNNGFLMGVTARLERNHLNRPYFPLSGDQFLIHAYWSDQYWGSERNFQQASAQWRSALPVYKGVTLQTGLFAGYSSTTNLPLHYRYYLGGISKDPVYNLRQFTMPGYSTHQLQDVNFQAARAALQIHLGEQFYLTPEWQAVYLSDTWSWRVHEHTYKHGFGISLNAITLIGPISISLSTPDLQHHYAFKIDVGFTF